MTTDKQELIMKLLYEYCELDDKIIKLHNAINSYDKRVLFNSITILKWQLKFMTDYRDTLLGRIKEIIKSKNNHETL